MGSHFSHKSMGSRASIVSGRGKQTGAWAVGPRAVNKAKGGMGGGCGCYVVCEWCMGGVIWWVSGVWVVALGVTWCNG
jgi:hypothetical protein